jgi:hypothetical protein
MNGTVCAVLTSQGKKNYFYAWSDQILCYGTLHAIGKLALKTANVTWTVKLLAWKKQLFA